MQKTPFAGLTALDASEPLSTDDFSVLTRNPWITDALLRVGAVTHRHDAHPPLAAPTGAPTAAVADTGGHLPSDLTITVAYSLLDEFGGETLASPLATVTTRAGVVDPEGSPILTTSTAAGALMAGDYAYAVSVTDGAGGETAVGPEAFVTILPGSQTNRIIVSGLAAILAASGGAAWRLWRQANGGLWYLLATGTGDTLTDDGSIAGDCTIQPPISGDGDTNATSTLQVTVPALPADATGFRLYATPETTFGAVSLLGEYPAADAGQAKTFLTLDESLTGAPLAAPTAIAGAQRIDPETEIAGLRWRTPVADAAALPSSGNTDGEARVALDTGRIYVWNDTAWVTGPDATRDVGDITGLTSTQIDALYPTAPSDGTMATGLEGATAIALLRRGGKWHKSAAYTEIA